MTVCVSYFSTMSDGFLSPPHCIFFCDFMLSLMIRLCDEEAGPSASFWREQHSCLDDLTQVHMTTSRTTQQFFDATS